MNDRETIIRVLKEIANDKRMFNHADYWALICDEAAELLKSQEPRMTDDWISVKDRLPDAAGYECLVCAVNENYNQTHVFTAHTGYGEPGWWTGNVNYMSRPAESPRDTRLHPALKVTHWMPLPEPPKEVVSLPNADLISREAAIAEVEQWAEHGYDVIHWTGIKAMLETQPAVDAAPSVHGRWIKEFCSECGQYVYHGDANNYCPNCGATMDGDGDA